jgi:hypothetical protein
MSAIIMLNVVRQAHSSGTPWFNYIIGRLIKVGWTKERADEVLHELVELDLVEEKLDENKVAWYRPL